MQICIFGSLYFRVNENTNLYYRVDKQQCFNYLRGIYGLYATADIFLARLGKKRTERVGTRKDLRGRGL